VTRPGEVYVEQENDKQMRALTIPEAGTNGCAWGTTYEHAFDGEPLAEDEQLACDSQTFSVNGTTATVVWIRNTGHTVFSYYAPGGKCPLPTFTTYLSPHSVPLSGITSFCASTVVHFLEGYKALPAGLPVTFTTGTRPLGVGYTTGGPDVCTPPMPNPLPLGAFIVTASFAGTDAYLPSSGSGLVVSGTGLPVAAQNPALPAGVPSGQAPPGGPAQPVPAPQASGAEQAQAQAQSDAQAQAQAQSQSQAQGVAQLQPGVMVQRQKQNQIATQRQGTGMQAELHASAIRRTTPAPLVAVAFGALMLGFGWMARRPRWALARSPGSRRRT